MDGSAPLKIDVGIRLKQARKALKLTQEGLCKRTGMPLPSLRDYELGKRIPGGEALAMFLRAGIAPAWVLTGAGEMFCKPAEATGIVIAAAIRQSGLSIDDAVARLDIDVHELLGYLEGRLFPADPMLVRVSEITGYPLEKLRAARELGDALAQIEVMHARVESRKEEAAVNCGLTPDQVTLLARYEQADEKGKALLLKIGAAVASPSLKAWFEAGSALADAATIFETKR